MANSTREAVYRAVVKFIDENGYSPSMRELCRMCGLASPSTVLTHLRMLQTMGRIQMAEGGRARSITLPPRRDTCWYCGGRLIWGCDYDYADVYGEGEGIVTHLHCKDCGARVTYELEEEKHGRDEG